MDSFLDKLIRWWRFKKIVKYIPKDSVVCDLGCGKEASFLRNISSLIKQGIGLDAEVEDYKDLKFEFKRFKILKEIPLEEESCDVITLMAVLEHLSNPQEILNETFRILKTGGKLIITTPTPLAKPLLEFLAFKLRFIDKNQIRDHKNYFWPENIKKMLLKIGFKEEKIKSDFFEFFLNSLIVATK